MMALFASLMIIINATMQSLNEYKKMFIFVLAGLIVKTILNVPLMYIFYSLAFHASYGVITASISGYLTTIILSLNFLNKKFKVNYEQTFNKTINIILTVIIMAIIILLMQFVIPIDTHHRLLALVLVILYALVGGSIYIYLTIKNKLLIDIFGKTFIERILIRLKIKIY